jgi:cytochrome P450
MSAGAAPQTDDAVAFFDLFDPGFQPSSPAVYAAREACWYARTPLGYAVLRYDEVATLLRDRRLRQCGVESLAAQEITGGLLADWMRMSLLNAVPAIWRVTTEDVDFNGLQIPAGTFLSLFVTSANTDPRVFGPDGFDIGVERPAQLAFGGSPHYCLGAPLARVEMAEALPILAARLRGPELAGSVCWRPAMGICGLVTLPIRFRSSV